MDTLLKQLIAAGREKVLDSNLRVYDIACASYLEELDDNPFDSDDIAERLFRAIRKHQEQPIGDLPPELCRRPGEGHIAWMDRCYEKF